MIKKGFTVAAAVVLAILMLASVWAFPALQVKDIGADDAADRSPGFDMLSETKEFQTTQPNELMDFTTNELHTNFTNVYHIEVALKEGYTTFTMVGGDPSTWMKAPSCSLNQAQYVKIKYRTEVSGKGAIYCTSTANGNLSSPVNWQWTNSGEWETVVFCVKDWQTADADVFFDIFRFDVFEFGGKNNADLDIQYIAYFSTEADAEGFNYEEYMAKLAYEEEQKRAEEEAKREVDWPDPPYKEMTVSDKDQHEGTLKYTVSEDGATVTISYEVNGETLSYTVPNSNNYLFGGYAGTDDLNRPLYDAGEVGLYGQTGERYVGLFYFLWQGEHGDSGVFDLQKIIDKHGVQGAGHVSCGDYGPVGAMHWFAEPLYGYYYANDAWVQRKHAELLTMAGVDFLYVDVTNGFSYIPNALQLMECLHDLNERGFDAPQIVFYTNSGAENVIRQLYDHIYKLGKFEDTWFRINGKPVIIGPAEANIDDFFTMKQNQWPTEASKTNGWPWMDFEWPARLFPSAYDYDGAAISVSVAQHSGNCLFSTSSLYGFTHNRGRSFTNPKNIASNRDAFASVLSSSYHAWAEDQSLTAYGLNFQAQWDHAIESDAMYILVTGWNEWVAQRQPTDDGSIKFVDTSSMEFSRDAEMMRGGYFDNYYMQLIYNIQRAKGTAPIVVQDSRKPINVTGDFDQWQDVTVTYQDATGDVKDRDAVGFGKTPYTNTSGRNDIESAKVTSDTQNLYFYVKTVYDVSMFDTESSWMQLYLNVDGRDGEKGESGWYGYDYIINYKAKDAFTTTVAKYNGADGQYGFEIVGDVSYRAKDNEMMVTVPLSMLGIENYRTIDVEFKWADSKTIYDEMEDFYCDGDVAPLGRLNYVYQNYIPGVTQVEPETEPATEALSEEPTELLTEDASTDPGEASTDAVTTTGCRSSVSMLAVLAVIVALPLLGRKREDSFHNNYDD